MHFGHQTRRWNPKMRRFILGERNGIYIIDLKQDPGGLEEAYGYVRDLVAEGGSSSSSGTKKQTQGPIATYARACGMPYVNERWLGGMLTNFATISSRTGKLREYEAMERAGDFDAMPKKEGLRHRRELEKLRRNLGGIRDLDRLPDAVFVIDTKKEHIAVTEANKLGDADRGRGRHQLRPRRDHLRDPRQRRRHPLRRAHVPGAWPRRSSRAGGWPSTGPSRRADAGGGAAGPRRPRGVRLGPARCRHRPGALRTRGRPRASAPGQPTAAAPAASPPRPPRRRPRGRGARTGSAAASPSPAPATAACCGRRHLRRGRDGDRRDGRHPAPRAGPPRAERWPPSPPRTSRRCARPPAPGCSTASAPSRRPTATSRRPSSGCARRALPARPSVRTARRPRARWPWPWPGAAPPSWSCAARPTSWPRPRAFVDLADELAQLVAEQGRGGRRRAQPATSTT